MLTQARLKDLLEYTPATNVWTWRIQRGAGRAGKEAGHLVREGYRVIEIDGRQYSSNRLAVLYTTGEWPRRYGGLPLTQARLREILNYNPATGRWTWRTRKTDYPPHEPGDIAGSLSVLGYWVIGIDGRPQQSSRLAFLYMTGEWPIAQVDHKDTDKANDIWTNLRPATQSENACNTRLRSDNTSGFKGVSFNKRNGSWQAQLTSRGRHIKLGYHPTPLAAHEAVKAARLRLHGEFARHK